MTLSGNEIDVRASASGSDENGAKSGPSRRSGGFFATLTPEQEAAIMAYRGPETLGDRQEVERLPDRSGDRVI